MLENTDSAAYALTLSSPAGGTSTAFALLLDGTGTISLDGATIAGTAANEILENNGNTISGSGTVGDGTDGNLTLDNSSGTLDANVAGQTLTLNTDSNTIVNAGVLEATNGGQLSVRSAVDNSGGSIDASGGVVNFWLGVNGGAATINDGGTLEFAWTSNVGTTFDGAGTLQLDNQNLGYYTGTVSGFGSGDAIDLTALSYSAANESLTWNQSTGTLSVSNGTATESVVLAGTYTQNDFALVEDRSGGTEVVSSPMDLTVAVVDNLPVQVGQTLVAQATLDPGDAGATVDYQWQALIGGNWTDVGGATTANYNGGLASLLQLTAAEEGDQLRVQASFSNSADQLVTTTSTPTVAVAEVTPVITPAFSYTVDDLSIEKVLVPNGILVQIYNDTFSQAPPDSPDVYSSGVGNGSGTAVAFFTNGSTWATNGSGAVLSSTGLAPERAVARVL